MADVWYPGRPPLRAPEIIEGLTHYVGALQVCCHQCAPEHLEQADRICDHLMEILAEESADCLGSDADINALVELLPTSFDAAVLCVQNGQWDEIEDITSSVDAVRWALIHKLDELTVQGKSHDRDTPTEEPRRAAPWPRGEEDAEQKNWADAPTLAQLEAEEALPSSEEEEADGLTTSGPDTLAPALETSPLP